MNLRLFLSVLLVYRSNFHMLHWQAAGKEFDLMHKQAAKYYEKMLCDADIVAEKAMMLGQSPVNYPEAFALLQEADHQFKILPSDTVYNYSDFIENTDIMFSDILYCLQELLQSEEVQDIANVGIKAALECMYEQYDLQLRYINKRRSGGIIVGPTTDQEDNEDIDDVEDDD